MNFIKLTSDSKMNEYVTFEHNGKEYTRKLNLVGRQFSDLIFRFKNDSYFFYKESNTIEFSEYYTLHYKSL